MNPTYRSAEALLGCRLLTRDGMEAGLRDLILDIEQWRVRFLTADAKNWALDRDAVLVPRLVASIDEDRGIMSLDLTASGLEASPLLSVSDGLAGFDVAGMPTPPNWREHWRARMQPEGEFPREDDPGGDMAPPPAPGEDDEVGADLSAETDLSADQLIRAETLRGLRAETADGTVLTIQDLLIDDTDWALAYLDLLLPADRGARGGSEAKPLRCLLARSGIDWLNPKTETLHLSVFMQELRDAGTGQLPVAGGAGTSVRILTPKG
jgi:hypothetical protein